MTSLTEFRLMLKPTGKPWYQFKGGTNYRTDVVWDWANPSAVPVTEEEIVAALTKKIAWGGRNGFTGKWRIDRRTVTLSDWVKVPVPELPKEV